MIMERRRFIATVVAAIGASQSRCLVADVPGGEGKSSTPVDTEWGRFSPLQRIQRLELKQYPMGVNFDPIAEMVVAAAQFYCANARCDQGAEALGKSVEMVTPDQVVSVYEQIYGRELTPAEKFDHARKLEVIDPRTNRILVSPTAIHADVVDQGKTLPQNIRRFEPKDYETILLKSVLIHAFTHPRASRERLATPRIPIEGTDFTITGVMGFTFTGVSSNGSGGYITGLNEAFTEYESIVVKRKTGDYLSTEGYAEGVKLVVMLNQASKIAPEQFKDYYEGQKNLIKLLSKWGSIRNPNRPAVDAALQAMVIIALRVDYPHLLSQDRATAEIIKLLG